MLNVCVIQINVSDMDTALDFYCDLLGFRIASKEHYPRIVELATDRIPIILNTVVHPASIDYPRSSQTLLVFCTGNLERVMNEYRTHGVELLHDSPLECPVGKYVAFKDPFGNVHEILQKNTSSQDDILT